MDLVKQLSVLLLICASFFIFVCNGVLTFTPGLGENGSPVTPPPNFLPYGSNIGKRSPVASPDFAGRPTDNYTPSIPNIGWVGKRSPVASADFDAPPEDQLTFSPGWGQGKRWASAGSPDFGTDEDQLSFFHPPHKTTPP
ncbi:uncharacterized protein LOC129745348 [Uranotaenia lowii]|uniref:uncharacterized protein LOC129745348 n=1 Tax=Uranotaenia lowii TaxID=190385 RepID=UPI002478721F|nr:uncharacterized protein LOC129745348 [Uranotaenia lowii]